MVALSAVRSQIASFSYVEPHFTLLAKFKKASINGLVGLQKLRQGNTIKEINGEDGNKIADLASRYPLQLNYA